MYRLIIRLELQHTHTHTQHATPTYAKGEEREDRVPPRPPLPLPHHGREYPVALDRAEEGSVDNVGSDPAVQKATIHRRGRPSGEPPESPVLAVTRRVMATWVVLAKRVCATHWIGPGVWAVVSWCVLHGRLRSVEDPHGRHRTQWPRRTTVPRASIGAAAALGRGQDCGRRTAAPREGVRGSVATAPGQVRRGRRRGRGRMSRVRIGQEPPTGGRDRLQQGAVVEPAPGAARETLVNHGGGFGHGTAQGARGGGQRAERRGGVHTEGGGVQEEPRGEVFEGKRGDLHVTTPTVARKPW